MEKPQKDGLAAEEMTAAGDGAPQRWSPRRKQDAVRGLFRGESMEALNLELGVEVHWLEQWQEMALVGMESWLRERSGDPLRAELD